MPDSTDVRPPSRRYGGTGPLEPGAIVPSPSQPYPNVWDVPGGHLDVGESPADAVHRELHEELGVAIRIDNADPFRVYEPALDLTLHAWVVTEGDGEIANLAPEEHDQIAWFELDDLDGLELADAALKGCSSMPSNSTDSNPSPGQRRIARARRGDQIRRLHLRRT